MHDAIAIPRYAVHCSASRGKNRSNDESRNIFELTITHSDLFYPWYRPIGIDLLILLLSFVCLGLRGFSLAEWIMFVVVNNGALR